MRRHSENTIWHLTTAHYVSKFSCFLQKNAFFANRKKSQKCENRIIEKTHANFFFHPMKKFFSIIYQHFRRFSVGIIGNYGKLRFTWDFEILQNGPFWAFSGVQRAKREKCEKLRFLKTPYLLKYSFFFDAIFYRVSSNPPKIPKKMVIPKSDCYTSVFLRGFGFQFLREKGAKEAKKKKWKIHIE